MPYKDRAKEMAVKAATEKRLYYPKINISIRRDDSAFYDSLMDAASVRGISAAEYMRRATREKLERDGELRV